MHLFMGELVRMGMKKHAKTTKNMEKTCKDP